MISHGLIVYSLCFLEGLEHVQLKLLVLVGHVAELGDEGGIVLVGVVVSHLGYKFRTKLET